MPKKIDLSGSNNPSSLIPLHDLQLIVSRYRIERYDRLVPAHISSDGRAVWLSKDAMDQFFEENPGCTGIRFYYGVVDDLNHANGAHNLVIMATDASGNDNVDRSGDDDAVIITKTYDMAIDATSKSAVCPPPNRPCQGNSLTYQ